MSNALGLVEDAHALLLTGSAGRAQALQVLAMEEFAKAVWLYESAAEDWTAGAAMVRIGDADRRHQHLAKLTKSLTYDAGLEPFWGDFSAWEIPTEGDPDDLLAHFGQMLTDYQRLAAQLNGAKQAGFYVDLVDGVVVTPEDMAPHGLNGAIERTADVILMALIRDHTRMKLEMPADSYDSTSELQWRAMGIAHADEVETYRNSPTGSSDSGGSPAPSA